MLKLQIDIPSRQSSVLAVVLEPENLDRMKAGDPVTLESIYHGGLLKPSRYPLSLLIAYLEDTAELIEIAKRDPIEALAYLERGRKWDAAKDGLENAKRIVPDKA